MKTTMRGLKVRPARLDDHKAYRALSMYDRKFHHKARSDAFAAPRASTLTLKAFKELLAWKEGNLLVAVSGSKVVGKILMWVFNEDGPAMVHKRLAYVSDLAVAEGIQGRGVGQKLMATAEALAKKQGAKTMLLTVWQFNQRAVKFYNMQGYQHSSSVFDKVL